MLYLVPIYLSKGKLRYREEQREQIFLYSLSGARKPCLAPLKKAFHPEIWYDNSVLFDQYTYDTRSCSNLSDQKGTHVMYRDSKLFGY